MKHYIFKRLNYPTLIIFSVPQGPWRQQQTPEENMVFAASKQKIMPMNRDEVAYWLRLYRKDPTGYERIRL